MQSLSCELLLAFLCSLLWSSVNGDLWSCYKCQAGYKSSYASKLKDFLPMINTTGKTNFGACAGKFQASSMTSSYKCSGADKCLKFTYKFDEEYFTYRSCATSNECSAVNHKADGKKGVYQECCTGNYCNHAVGQSAFTGLTVMAAITAVWAVFA